MFSSDIRLCTALACLPCFNSRHLKQSLQKLTPKLFGSQLLDEEDKEMNATKLC